MATETEGSSSPQSAQFVGNSFAQQYYQLLFRSPEHAYKFYEDSSVLSWPGPNGEMTSVTTIQNIKDLILSLDCKGCKAEIKTVDAQDSCQKGVIVLVTGCLTGKDSVERSFSQTFFLAPHAKGYYVLNDVFRFVEVAEAVSASAVNDVDVDVASAPLSSTTQESPNQSGSNHNAPTKVKSNGIEVDSSDMKGSVDSNSSTVKEAVVSQQLVSSSKDDGHTIAKSASNEKDSSQKMSYASIVAKETIPNSPTQSTMTVVIAPSSTHQQQQQQQQRVATPKASTPRSNGATQNSNTNPEVKSIYVGNLPSDVTVKQLEAIFKKFGSIKKGGIQIRYYEDGFCYGFVEFESSKSVNLAIEAHIITIGLKEAYITEKRSTNQATNGRGRFPVGKSEFRNDNYRNRENFEGRSYGRYPNGTRGEFSGQSRGPTRSNGEAHQKVYQNGDGRTARPSGMN